MNKKGFTIIEALVFLFIFVVVTLTFYRVLTVGSAYIISVKNRLGAIAVANEKMEIIRNLAYDDIGVAGGSVSGNIPEYEDVMENTIRYAVHTNVIYTDDPSDGIGYSDSVWFEDYKEVTVTVSWTGSGTADQVQTVSRFVPPGIEVKNPNDGILSINIFSDQPGGKGISGTTVHVVNDDTGLNTTVQTDSSGNITLMGDTIKTSIQKYKITVSKSGYETVNTMDPYPATAYNPVDTHASVVIGSVNIANIVQNKLAQLKISTEDYFGNSIPGIDFHLVGGRKLGTQTTAPYDPVYNLSGNYSTNSGGEKDFGSVSPGEYTLAPSLSSTSYVLIDTDPVSPFSLFSENDLDLKIKLASKNATSLLLKVQQKDSNGDMIAVPSAQAELKNSSGYDVTQAVSATGTAFFPTTSGAFDEGTYDLKITADGFDENNSQITIGKDELQTETITLIPSS
jgi:hypothetical protein